jgi:hypothetical protein
MKLIDKTGNRYGKLLVLRKHETPRMWLCVCDCGNEKLVTGSNLASGAIRSCGCLATQWASSMGSNPEYIHRRSEKLVKHGEKRRSGATVEYKTWLVMKRRCYDEKYKDFETWGGRGIRVCERWRNSFPAFLKDMGRRPEGSFSIDRKNENRDYSPDNCRWATPLQQGEHMRPNIQVSYGGVEFFSLKEACRVLGLPYQTIFSRVKYGYSLHDALSIGAKRAKPRRSRESYLRKSCRTT